MSSFNVSFQEINFTMETTSNSWDQSREYFEEVYTTLKFKLSDKWKKIAPTEEMKCQSMARLRKEMKSCIDLFLDEEDNILIKYKIFILRDEINNLWSLCWSTESDKLSFKEYSVDIYTEEIMAKHEIYKKHLESLYDSNSELFSMLKKYVETQNHIKDLEIEKNDPKRLKNRGAQLLKSEKELKDGKKELVKLEGSIVQLASKHNHKYGKPLIIHGEEIMAWLNRLKSENKEMKSAVKSRVRPWHTANTGSSINLESSAKKKKLNF